MAKSAVFILLWLTWGCGNGRGSLALCGHGLGFVAQSLAVLLKQMIVIRREKWRGAGVRSRPPATGNGREMERCLGWHSALTGRLLSHSTGAASQPEGKKEDKGPVLTLVCGAAFGAPGSPPTLGSWFFVGTGVMAEGRWAAARGLERG